MLVLSYFTLGSKYRHRITGYHFYFSIHLLTDFMNHLQRIQKLMFGIFVLPQTIA